MKIEIGWFSEDDELSSTRLIGGIYQKHNIPLVPVKTATGNYHSLAWEVTNLSNEVTSPDTKLESRTVATILNMIQFDLQEKGLWVNIFINGTAPLHYAAQQETEVRKVSSRVKEATTYLKRAWLRTPSIRGALQALE